MTTFTFLLLCVKNNFDFIVLCMGVICEHYFMSVASQWLLGARHLISKFQLLTVYVSACQANTFIDVNRSFALLINALIKMWCWLQC